MSNLDIFFFSPQNTEISKVLNPNLHSDGELGDYALFSLCQYVHVSTI